ncbi:hypothetical protein Gasu2_50430 [Galdieria sulphuraria]|uniref:BZIP domain-containing protein n=1 Tax=Galdieria sulphuraria TaxID=130081 RepID=M2W5J1_GALSU|nr:uncharacterized protein Gasu_18080 [Galdieria sulphuraria]EME31051.1 hypothetical protein Gasu_18080 [Galdieria sulphuraria]GJD10875.1 hypothetical protein Gasu2_50430 [Galdieria sulphuraria]|eukprot:XP_005707571.1 hypothetical protein Gasu_18080 [Galdieria sulphuraria]
MSSEKFGFRSNTGDTVFTGLLAASSGHELRHLSGTTSARARRMSTEERNLVLLKRKLRNRASAVRSRKRRLAIIEQLYAQLIELSLLASRLEERLRALELGRLRMESFANHSSEVGESEYWEESVPFQEEFYMGEPVVLLFDSSPLLAKSFADWSVSPSDLELENYFSLDLNYPNNSI